MTIILSIETLAAHFNSSESETPDLLTEAYDDFDMFLDRSWYEAGEDSSSYPQPSKSLRRQAEGHYEDCFEQWLENGRPRY